MLVKNANDERERQRGNTNDWERNENFIKKKISMNR